MCEIWGAMRAGRRDLLKATLLASAAAVLPWHGAAAQAAPPRNRTMILVWSGSREGRWVDYDLWNPYSLGANHQNGPNPISEPLAHYTTFPAKTPICLPQRPNS